MRGKWERQTDEIENGGEEMETQVNQWNKRKFNDNNSATHNLANTRFPLWPASRSTLQREIESAKSKKKKKTKKKGKEKTKTMSENENYKMEYIIHIKPK